MFKLKRTYLWAIGFACVIGLWLGSGMIFANKNEGATPSAANKVQKQVFRVRVTKLQARQRQAEIIVRGRTSALRRIEARAQTAGLVKTVPYNEGTRVNAGDMLCQLELSTRPARLAEARAKLKQAELDLKAASALEQQEFVSKTSRAEKQAKYDAAVAGVALMEKEIEYTKIRATESGIIEKRPAESGSFLQIGGLCATVVVLNPMRVVGNVSEREVAYLREGMDGTARLVTGDVVKGTIQFVSSTAEQNTRTFQIELEVPNKAHKLRDGITAEIRIPLPPQKAHLVSASSLTLNDRGQIGIKIVDADSRAKFVAANILADGTDGVWIGGMPDEISLITVGQEYVVDGQKVEPVMASESRAK